MTLEATLMRTEHPANVMQRDVGIDMLNFGTGHVVDPDLATKVADKISATQAWIGEQIPNQHALVLDGSHDWSNTSDEVRRLVGGHICDLITETYHGLYPLKMDPEAMARDLETGKVSPVLLFAAPRSLTAEMVRDNPGLLKGEALTLLATASTVAKPDGTYELGRAAGKRGVEFAGVRAGAAVQLTILDAMARGLTVVADLRAAAGRPIMDGQVMAADSGPTQGLYGKKLVPYNFGHLYQVYGGLEPFVSVAASFGQDRPTEAAAQPVHIANEDDVPYLSALLRGQNGGNDVPLVVGVDSAVEPYAHAKPPVLNGGTIYASVEVGSTDSTGPDRRPLRRALKEAEAVGPTTVVTVPATAEGSHAQMELANAGYHATGARLGYTALVDGKTVQRPPVIFMSRLTGDTASGNLDVAPLQLARGVYAPELEREIRALDAKLRASIG